MFKLFAIFFVIVYSSEGRHKHFGYQNDGWDVLLFTQNWPATVCLQWKHEKPQNECNMPHKPLWTVHGIWPTKLGTKGPGFCNRNMKFDLSEVESITQSLTERWVSVHEGNGADQSFWKHEWEKHGSCAAELVSLNSEMKYFSAGLNWNDQFNLGSILEEAGFVPGGPGQTLDTIFRTVRSAVGADPFISCYRQKKGEKTYLIDIRLCFDKSLSLTDCDGVKRRQDEHPLTQNCPEDTLIYYLDPNQVLSDFNFQFDNQI